MKANTITQPKARTERIIVKEVQDEVLVYDMDRDTAHCLNLSAAAVWKKCDGRSTPAQIADSLRTESQTNVNEDFVWLALEQLARDHLLEGPLEWSASVPRLTRREAVRRFGIGAAIAIPLITSILAPTPAQAATCIPKGGLCSTNADCCSGSCNPNHCK
jgi:Coenzyme PQQ synthesis protein D (PqqD)